jgi:hypothetical protein
LKTLSLRKQDILARQARKKRPRKFSLKEERILSGWVIYSELSHSSSTSTNLKEFVLNAFGKTVSAKWMTSFMKRYGFSLKLPSNATEEELSQESMQAAVDYLANVREFITLHDIENVVVVDKTSLMTSPFHKYRRHIAFRGRGKPRRITPPRGYAHIVYTGLKINGEKCPFFVQTVEKDLALGDIFKPGEGFISYVPSKQRRRGEFGFLKYLDYLVENGHLPERSLLLFDGEKSFVTPKVQQFLLNHAIFCDVIRPSCLHQLLSPCDNSFHSTFKLKYYSEISNMSVSSLLAATKLKIAKRCYDMVSSDSVISMFKKCGLLGGDLNEIVTRLVYDGLCYTDRLRRDFYRMNLKIFLSWIKENRLERVYLKNYSQCRENIMNFLNP